MTCPVGLGLLQHRVQVKPVYFAQREASRFLVHEVVRRNLKSKTVCYLSCIIPTEHNFPVLYTIHKRCKIWVELRAAARHLYVLRIV